MEISMGLTIGFLLLALSLGILAIRAQRDIDKLKKRTRLLNERLEVVEKFNGLNQTSTDFTIKKS